jgi:hypothetical protein
MNFSMKELFFSLCFIFLISQSKAQSEAKNSLPQKDLKTNVAPVVVHDSIKEYRAKILYSTPPVSAAKKEEIIIQAKPAEIAEPKK